MHVSLTARVVEFLDVDHEQFKQHGFFYGSR